MPQCYFENQIKLFRASDEFIVYQGAQIPVLVHNLHYLGDDDHRRNDGRLLPKIYDHLLHFGYTNVKEGRLAAQYENIYYRAMVRVSMTH